ncbi:MAG: DUF952 domain-containing protein [Myxococcota bacterium]|nr:DUF952 domain-containing protein [Myxococcota bacterium]
MTIVLNEVSQPLVDRSRFAQTSLHALIGPRFADVTTRCIGSSLWLGSLSRGDIDLLIESPQGQLSALIDYLKTVASVAQPENWADDFASFEYRSEQTGLVGLQVVSVGSDAWKAFDQQTQALQSAELRVKYDIAKKHGATGGPLGYAKVKEVFWTTLDAPGPKWSPVSNPILKVLRPAEWFDLLTQSETQGAPIDISDGYIHFSTPPQAVETVAKHFQGESDLWVLTLDAGTLGPKLKWEPSRGGALFPHLYDKLKLADVHLARPWG